MNLLTSQARPPANIVLRPATVSDCNVSLSEVEIAVSQWLMGNPVTTVYYGPYVSRF